MIKVKKRFMRNCIGKGCGVRFRPTGKHTELCDDCWAKQRSAKGIRVEKRLHNVWKEREIAKARGIKIRRLIGKWQYIYRSSKGEVSLIQIVPGISKKEKMIWELMRLKPNGDVERFESKTLAYERVRELLS